MSMPPLPEGLTMEQHIDSAVKIFLHGCLRTPAPGHRAKPKKP